jgi:hypothetical protein
MTTFSKRILAALLPASAFALCIGMAAQASPVQDLPVDHPMRVNGVETACTGIGQREEHEGRWGSYPVKMEAVQAHGEYLADEDVTIRPGRGAEILRVHCAAPWVLMRLEPGHYDATMRVPNSTSKEVAFTVPRRGQRDVIVRFPTRATGVMNQS